MPLLVLTKSNGRFTRTLPHLQTVLLRVPNCTKGSDTVYYHQNTLQHDSLCQNQSPLVYNSRNLLTALYHKSHKQCYQYSCLGSGILPWLSSSGVWVVVLCPSVPLLSGCFVTSWEGPVVFDNTLIGRFVKYRTLWTHCCFGQTAFDNNCTYWFVFDIFSHFENQPNFEMIWDRCTCIIAHFLDQWCSTQYCNIKNHIIKFIEVFIIM